MPQPHAIVLRAAGVNCEEETAYAWQIAGASAGLVHISELRAKPALLDSAQILTVPGGFSYGDDIAAGQILAQQLSVWLGDQLRAFCDRGGLLLGICNGFQVLCKAGLLPAPDFNDELSSATVSFNDSRKYEDRWVKLERRAAHCVFLQHLEQYEMPVAHGEGKVMTRTPLGMQKLFDAGCVALVYSGDNGEVGYPANPNGSMMDVAGLCDKSGRVLGLMPHPERFIATTNHPEWTSRPVEQPHGLELFRSACAALN